MTDAEIFMAACRQINAAQEAAWYRHGNPVRILTRMTRPMWNACTRYVESSGPTFPCAPGPNTLMGSEVVLVESDEMASISFPI